MGMSSASYKSETSFEIVQRFLGTTDILLEFTLTSRDTDDGIQTLDLTELLKRICQKQWEIDNE